MCMLCVSMYLYWAKYKYVPHTQLYTVITPLASHLFLQRLFSLSTSTASRGIAHWAKRTMFPTVILVRHSLCSTIVSTYRGRRLSYQSMVPVYTMDAAAAAAADADAVACRIRPCNITPPGSVFQARLIARQPKRMPIPNDTSSESSRRDASNADLLGTGTIPTTPTIPTAVEISSMENRFRRGTRYRNAPYTLPDILLIVNIILLRSIIFYHPTVCNVCPSQQMNEQK